METSKHYKSGLFVPETDLTAVLLSSTLKGMTYSVNDLWIRN